jgi:hypothetical protein
LHFASRLAYNFFYLSLSSFYLKSFQCLYEIAWQTDKNLRPNPKFELQKFKNNFWITIFWFIQGEFEFGFTSLQKLLG